MPMRILVVDDDPDLREVLRDALTMAGYEVALAQNGVEAVRMVAEDPPDAMVVDLVMPEKEGLETIAEVKRSTPQMRILAMSGGGTLGPHGYLAPALKLGADRALAKPFAISTLLEEMGALFRE